MKLEKFPRYPLTFGPSPIHPLKRLSEHLGVEVWAKRDDCNSGLAYGGNKVRKLEYLLPEAIAQGCDTLVSIGGVQSNHTRQVAAVAAHVGMKAHLVQERWVNWNDSVYDRVGNIQLSRILGANVELNPSGFSIGIRESWERALETVRSKGGKPYAIPAGASDHPLGGLGFTNFALEVAAQEQEHGVFFDHVVVCSVTGSTQAGMIVGFAAQEKARKVIGIDASAKPAETFEPGNNPKVGKYRFTVKGSAGDFAGGARSGDKQGMAGGTIVVEGNVGERAGDRMRRGTIIARGTIGSAAGSRMMGGTLWTEQGFGAGPGLLLRRGTLIGPKVKTIWETANTAIPSL